VEVQVSIVLVVLIVWTLVAFVALALARTLCAAAARADAEQAEQRVRRPVEAPRYTTTSTSRDPHARLHPEPLGRPGVITSLRSLARR
jgi:hypothetical protein